MFGILGLGFLLGMQHALEADHIAAVSSIAARRSHVADIVKHGLTWGLGHTLTLFVFAGAAILLGWAIPEDVARPLETAVGLMLIGLGAHVLWRLWRDRVHFHRHGHADGTVHFHAHSHAGETAPHVRNVHAHDHGFRWRTMLVGLMHGMAGSAALLVLAVTQASSPDGRAVRGDRGAAGGLRPLAHLGQPRPAGHRRPCHRRDRNYDGDRDRRGLTPHRGGRLDNK